MSAILIAAAIAAGSLSAAQAAPAPNPAAGAKVFQTRCQSCHAVAPGQRHGAGPNLAGVVGRKAASTDFAYSAALKASGLTWDKATLDRFLASPMKLVPGTRMLIPVADPKQRADLIAYLGALKK